VQTALSQFEESYAYVVLANGAVVIGKYMIRQGLIDVGPEAGHRGGKIVATGTPEEVAKNKVSRTAPFLKEVLDRKAVK
jgi:hypothetical protein